MHENSPASTWVDPDDAPELDERFFNHAARHRGERLLRAPTGTLTFAFDDPATPGQRRSRLNGDRFDFTIDDGANRTAAIVLNLWASDQRGNRTLTPDLTLPEVDGAIAELKAQLDGLSARIKRTLSNVLNQEADAQPAVPPGLDDRVATLRAGAAG